tara:strand:- start:2690 stop:3340 length:651 start_codon:yes stop_codon:yes gene_type:complete
MINKKIQSVYGIFKNKNTNKTIVYYPCPKNANTSAKLFFLRHMNLENNFIFIGDKIPSYKQEIRDFGEKNNLINFLPLKQKFEKVDANIKCCIIRDPIDRFISSYKNRILFHKDKSFDNHSIDMVLEKLEAGLFENKHFLPQNYFLGDNLNYFQIYADVKNINFFQNKINEFFEKNIEFPKLQTGGKNFLIKLNKKQIRRVKNIYQKDYEIFYKNQ